MIKGCTGVARILQASSPEPTRSLLVTCHCGSCRKPLPRHSGARSGSVASQDAQLRIGESITTVWSYGFRDAPSGQQMPTEGASRKDERSGSRRAANLWMAVRNFAVVEKSGLLPSKITGISVPVSFPSEGRPQSSRTRGTECGGRGGVGRDTRVAGRTARSVSGQHHADGRCRRGRRSRVVLAPVAGVKSRGGKHRPNRARMSRDSAGRRWQEGYSSPGRARIS